MSRLNDQAVKIHTSMKRKFDSNFQQSQLAKKLSIYTRPTKNSKVLDSKKPGDTSFDTHASRVRPIPVRGRSPPLPKVYPGLTFNDPQYFIVAKKVCYLDMTVTYVGQSRVNYKACVNISSALGYLGQAGETGIIQLYFVNTKTNKFLNKQYLIDSIYVGDLRYQFNEKINCLNSPYLQFINITDCCNRLRRNGQKETIDIELIMSRPVETWALYINVSRERTLEEKLAMVYLKQVRRRCAIENRSPPSYGEVPLETAIADFDDFFIKDFQVWGKKDDTFEQTACDVVAGPELVKLTCPITLQRLEHPARGKYCGHSSCFDVKVFLQMNEKQEYNWKCPICGERLDFMDLRISKSLRKIILSTPPTVLSVIKYPNRTFRHPDLPELEGFKNTETAATQISASLSVDVDDIPEMVVCDEEENWDSDCYPVSVTMPEVVTVENEVFCEVEVEEEGEIAPLQLRKRRVDYVERDGCVIIL